MIRLGRSVCSSLRVVGKWLNIVVVAALVFYNDCCIAAEAPQSTAVQATDWLNVPLPSGNAMPIWQPNASPNPELEPGFGPAWVPAILCVIIIVAAGAGCVGCKMKKACNKLAPALTNRVPDEVFGGFRAAGGGGGGDDTTWGSSTLGSCFCPSPSTVGPGPILNRDGKFVMDPSTRTPYMQVDVATITEFDPDSPDGLKSTVISIKPSEVVSDSTFEYQVQLLGIANNSASGIYRMHGELVGAEASPVVIEGSNPIVVKAIRGSFGPAAWYIEETISVSSDMVIWTPAIRYIKPIGVWSPTSFPPFEGRESVFFRVTAKTVEPNWN